MKHCGRAMEEVALPHHTRAPPLGVEGSRLGSEVNRRGGGRRGPISCGVKCSGDCIALGL